MSVALDLSTHGNRENPVTSEHPSPTMIYVSDTPPADSAPSPPQPSATTKKRKPRQSSAPSTTVPLPPCKVCGGTSTGYHFGVITCEACKAFFRRALIHKQEYRCARENNCNIVDKKLGNCSSCRLKKCFELGMSKGGVRKGRYSIALRTNTIVEAKALEGKPVAQSGPLSRDTSIFRAASEGNRVAQSGSVSHTKSISRDEFLANNESISHDGSLSHDSPTRGPASSVPSPMDILFRASDIARANAALSSTEPSTHRQNVELDLLIDALIGCQDAVYPNLKRMHEISLTDAQHRVYQEHQMKKQVFNEFFGKPGTVSTEEYQQIFAETGIDIDDRLSHFNMKGKAMEEAISQYVNFAKIIPGFKNLNPKDVSRLLKASHLEFWLFGNYMLLNKDLEIAVSWDGTHNTTKGDIVKFWSSTWVEEVFKFSDRIKKLNPSLEEIALIRVIILTYTDRCSLTDRKQIQILQEKYLDCLLYQLRKTSPRPNRRLYKIFDLLLALRDFTELNMKENKEFLAKWEFVIHEFPLWKEMLSYKEEF